MNKSGTTNYSPSMFTLPSTGVEQIGINQSVGMSYNTTSGTTSNPWSMPYVSTGLLDTIYGAHGTIQFNGANYMGVAPQNNMWTHTIPVWMAVKALNLIVLQPNGSGTQVNTYQIAFSGYQITTGTGASWRQLNLPTPVSDDPNSGYAGWDWVNGLSIWRGYSCPAPASGKLDDNVLATNCTEEGAFGTSNVTLAYSVQTSVTSGASSPSATISNLSYQYNSGSGNASQSFSVTVPSNLITTIHY